MDDWSELDGALAAMAASGSAEVREDGKWLAELSGLHCELRRHGKNALVHLWSSERNLTRRVLRVKERSAERIVLEVQRLSRAKPGRLEFVRTDGPRSAGIVAREQFRARLWRFLAEQFPDATVESLSASRDLEHSFSGLYVRGQMQEGPDVWAVLAVSPAESSATTDGMLAFGILWLDWTRALSERRAVKGLRLFVPEGGSRSLRERARGLSSAARTEIFEFSERENRVWKMEGDGAGNLESGLAYRRDVESALKAAQQSAEAALMLGADARRLTKVDARIVPETMEVAFCILGLEFARWSAQGILFGVGDALERLTKASEPALQRLMKRLGEHRNSLTSETNHSLYRAAPERWLEALILEDPSKLDAQLDPAHVYSQVPAIAAGDRGVLDLLGVTRKGRLVVMELKASEDLQMPVQAVDYWLRARRHQSEGDFERYGYFRGVEINPQPPLLWLVAPGLRFHPATEVLVKYLSPEIQIARIGLNENWRRGVKVVFRQ